MMRNINGLPFAYESHGEGIPVVFLHGMPTDRRSLIPRFEPIFESARGSWRRIYPDLPGAGRTPARPAMSSFDAYVDEVAAFIEEETEGRRFALLGQSWGGTIALTYAKKHPERLAGLAIVAANLTTRPDASVPSRQVLVSEDGVFDGEPPAMAETLNTVATVHTRAIRDTMKRDVLPGALVADRDFIARISATLRLEGDDALPINFESPALVIAGRQDAVCGFVEARKFAERLPRATYAVLDRTAHIVAFEQGGLLRALVNEWLSRVREGLGEPYEPPA